MAIDNDDFNRSPVDTLVRIRTQSDVTAAALLEPFKSIFDEMRLAAADYEWDAQHLGRAGKIRFQGSVEVGRLRVRKFMSLLKDTGGRWRRFQVATATGEQFHAYAASDRNRATIHGETFSRRLSRFLADRNIGGTYRSRRQDFSVSRDWVPFARVVDITSDSFGIQWNLEALRDHGIERAAITKDFTDSTDPQGQMPWGVALRRRSQNRWARL